VKAKLACLAKDFKQAEQLYLQQRQVDEAMNMYKARTTSSSFPVPHPLRAGPSLAWPVCARECLGMD